MRPPQFAFWGGWPQNNFRRSRADLSPQPSNQVSAYDLSPTVRVHFDENEWRKAEVSRILPHRSYVVRFDDGSTRRRTWTRIEKTVQWCHQPQLRWWGLWIARLDDTFFLVDKLDVLLVTRIGAASPSLDNANWVHNYCLCVHSCYILLANYLVVKLNWLIWYFGTVYSMHSICILY